MEQTLAAKTSAAPNDRPCPSCSAVGLVQMSYPSITPPWNGLDVLVCQTCGFGFVPKVTFDLNEYYATTYGGSHNRNVLDPSFFATIDQNKSKKVRRSRAHARMLRRRFGRFNRVLDIGSGPGFFLHYVRAKSKFAIESDPHSQQMLKAVGAEVVESLDHIDNLDLIVMSHVLEHLMVDDYRDYMKTVMKRLRPSGVLLVEVPEWGNLNKNFECRRGKSHEPHTMFFSPAPFLSAVDGELVYFQNSRNAFAINDQGVDWSAPSLKESRVSSMMGVWRKR